VTRHAAHDAELQSDALTKLRTRGGRSRTQVAAALGIEADTYRRYENGQTELRVNQLRPFASALNTEPVVLLYELGFREFAALLPAPFSVRKALKASGVVPAGTIDRIEADIADWDEPNQRAHVAMVIESHTPTVEDADQVEQQQGKREEAG
jgi:transcriptional regulator with XRE-family HTH domain